MYRPGTMAGKGDAPTLLDAFGDEAASIPPRISAALAQYKANPRDTDRFASDLVAKAPHPQSLTKLVSSLPAVPVRRRILEALDDQHAPYPYTQLSHVLEGLEDRRPWEDVDRHRARRPKGEHRQMLASLLHENPGNPDLARYLFRAGPGPGLPAPVTGTGAFFTAPDEEADSRPLQHRRVVPDRLRGLPRSAGLVQAAKAEMDPLRWAAPHQIFASELRAVREKEVRDLHRPAASSAGSGDRAGAGASRTGRKRKRESISATVIHKGARGGLYRLTPGGKKVYVSSAGSTGSTSGPNTYVSSLGSAGSA